MQQQWERRASGPDLIVRDRITGREIIHRGVLATGREQRTREYRTGATARAGRPTVASRTAIRRAAIETRSSRLWDGVA